MSSADTQILGELRTLNRNIRSASPSGDLLLDLVNEVRMIRLGLSEILEYDLEDAVDEFEPDATPLT
jgi:hypothetical protein